ncbi:MAG: TlpA family protein disulfide reductase [Actinobacteria bacterium]|nr:TlpA family protein disulfide reductase [Actinomycetota bacterium]
MTTASKANGRGSVIWIAGLVLVVIAGIIAVAAARSSNQEGNAEVDAKQTAPVKVSGETLPDLPDAPGAADPAVGATIPTVTGQGFDGQAVSIDPTDGKPKLIVFAAHWCPHCQRELPIIADHLVRSPLPDDVELVAVSTSVAEERGNYPPSSWLQEINWKAPVMVDSDASEAARAFALPGFPYFVAVDADGKVVARTSGEIPTEEFDALVQAARSGTPPA